MIKTSKVAQDLETLNVRAKTPAEKARSSQNTYKHGLSKLQGEMGGIVAGV